MNKKFVKKIKHEIGLMTDENKCGRDVWLARELLIPKSIIIISFFGLIKKIFE